MFVFFNIRLTILLSVSKIYYHDNHIKNIVLTMMSMCWNTIKYFDLFCYKKYKCAFVKYFWKCLFWKWFWNKNIFHINEQIAHTYCIVPIARDNCQCFYFSRIIFHCSEKVIFINSHWQHTAICYFYILSLINMLISTCCVWSFIFLEINIYISTL